MKKEIIDIHGMQQGAASFRHVVKAGGFLFLSSQLSADLQTGTIIPGTITEQTTRAMDNVRFLIESCEGTMADIVKVVIYMRNIRDRNRINSVYRQYFVHGQEPAKVSIQAASPIESIDVEIDVIAVAPEG